MYEKEELIDNLYKELNDSYSRIDNLERCDELMTEKIKVVEWENYNLNQQLEMSISQYNQSLNLSQISNIENKHNFNTYTQVGNGLNLSMSESNILLYD